MRRFEICDATGRTGGCGVLFDDGQAVVMAPLGQVSNPWTLHAVEEWVRGKYPGSAIRYLDPPEGAPEKTLVDKLPGRCGGRACIAGTRLYVSLFVGCARHGWGDADIFREYPQVTPEQLDAAWRYYRANVSEIEAELREDEEDLSSEPAGKLPSARIQELMQEEAARLLTAGVTTMRTTEATLRAIVRYLDDQHRERLGRSPGCNK